MLLLDLQHSEGRKFLHEHPARAMSWQASRTNEIAEKPGVFKTDFDQCMLGSPYRKGTSLGGNVWDIMSLDGRFCDNSHTHVATAAILRSVMVHHLQAL